MKVTGIIKELLPLQSGTSERGDWQNQRFIFEYNEQDDSGMIRVRTVMLQAYGKEHIEKVGLLKGDRVTASFHTGVRNYNNNFYHEIYTDSIVNLSKVEREEKITKVDKSAAPTAEAPSNQ